MESYTIKQLKQVIVKYNLQTKISGYSKQNKDDLIINIKKHLDHNNGIFTPKQIQPIIIKSNFDTTPIKIEQIKKEEPKKEEPKKEEPKKEDPQKEKKDIKQANNYFKDMINDTNNMEPEAKLKYIKKAYKKISTQNKINNPSYYSTLDTLFKNEINEREKNLKYLTAINKKKRII